MDDFTSVINPSAFDTSHYQVLDAVSETLDILNITGSMSLFNVAKNPTEITVSVIDRYTLGSSQ